MKHPFVLDVLCMYSCPTFENEISNVKLKQIVLFALTPLRTLIHFQNRLFDSHLNLDHGGQRGVTSAPNTRGRSTENGWEISNAGRISAEKSGCVNKTSPDTGTWNFGEKQISSYHLFLSSYGMRKLVLDQVLDFFSVDSLHWCTQDYERNTEREPRAVRQDEKVSGGSKVEPREGASWHDKNAREGISGIFCFSVLLVGYSKNIMEK